MGKGLSPIQICPALKLRLYIIKAHVWSDAPHICVFLYAIKVVVHMESDWLLRCQNYFYKKCFKLRKEGNYYELWRITHHIQ